MSKSKFILLVIMTIVLYSCYSTRSYTGDGEIIDNGFKIKGGRYNIKLLKIPFDVAKKYKFKISNLPPGYIFTVGLEIEKNLETVKKIESHIKIELLTELGGKVISEEAPLNQWTLGYSMSVPVVYAYMNAKYKEQLLINDNVELIPIYTGVDCGSGTYFQPKKNSTYYMEITITPTGNAINETALILIESVGQNQNSNCS